MKRICHGDERGQGEEESRCILRLTFSYGAAVRQCLNKRDEPQMDPSWKAATERPAHRGARVHDACCRGHFVSKPRDPAGAYAGRSQQWRSRNRGRGVAQGRPRPAPSHTTHALRRGRCLAACIGRPDRPFLPARGSGIPAGSARRGRCAAQSFDPLFGASCAAALRLMHGPLRVLRSLPFISTRCGLPVSLQADPPPGRRPSLCAHLPPVRDDASLFVSAVRLASAPAPYRMN